ncbi:hypothetical protein [Lutimonas sp.]|uniref:hypothetical protein n=1 Tax=Lutimonas sp. TaxID=1872403 RepID=UPI003D9B0545
MMIEEQLPWSMLSLQKRGSSSYPITFIFEKALEFLKQCSTFKDTIISCLGYFLPPLI